MAVALRQQREPRARVTHEPARLVTSGTKAIRERLVQLSTAIEDTELDCSHFANYVYERVGFQQVGTFASVLF